MHDYIKNNSIRCNKIKNKNVCRNYCITGKFQSYDGPFFGRMVPLKSPITCAVQQICNNNQYKFQQYVLAQQNLYAIMRRFPERFPLIPWVSEMNLTPAQQRAYSNNWYRQFGTSQALPANDDWGGFYLPGSEVPFTD